MSNQVGQPPQHKRRIQDLSTGRIGLGAVEISLAVLAVAGGVLAALRLLDRGVFFDEFFTLAMTDPSLSPRQFFDYLKLDIHPSLYFLLVWAERGTGIDGVALLRGMNLAGVPLVAWALWFSVRQESINRTQAWLIAALCATSTFFLEEFAEIRPYYLAACASTAMVLVWRIAHARLAEKKPMTPGLLVAWGVTLALLCNLNYFGMLMGGFFTGALLLEAGLRGRWTPAALIAGISLLAAAPALALIAIQIGHQPANFWIKTTPIEAIEHFVQFGRGFVLNNLVLFAAGAITVLALLQSADLRKTNRTTLVLLAVIATFAMALFLMNEIKPLLVPRYLTPAAPPLIVAFVLLATNVRPLRWTPVAILVAALLATAEAVITDKHARDGWDVSAARVAEMATACPGSTVYIATYLGTSDYYTLDRVSRRVGHELYQKRYGFPMVELEPGDAVPVGGACPSIVWAEHTFEHQELQLDANGVLARHSLKPAENARLEYVSSGAIITVGPPSD
jgi:hypothetical protein